jgi:hypothetical protein
MICQIYHEEMLLMNTESILDEPADKDKPQASMLDTGMSKRYLGIPDGFLGQDRAQRMRVTDDIHQWMELKYSNRSPNSYAQRCSILRSFFKYCMGECKGSILEPNATKNDPAKDNDDPDRQ